MSKCKMYKCTNAKNAEIKKCNFFSTFFVILLKRYYIGVIM